MRVSKKLIALFIVTILCCAPLSAAMAQDQPAMRKVAIIDDDDKLEKMAVDAVVVRPLGICAIVGGALLFVVSLPFSALGKNVDEAAQTLVTTPTQYTFGRPLGKF